MTTIVTKNEYDHRGRLTAIKHKIGSQDTVTVAAYSYNELGQLIGKSLGKKATEPDYVSNAAIRYNERGWLKTSTAGNFSQQLNYQDGTNPQWNGNISQQLWGTTSTPSSTFSYQYDRLDRLSSGTATGMSEAMLYDDMGNITKLTRDATDINYSYVGNRLSSLSGGLSVSYTYDANGNVLTDRTGMTLTYNQLNLPATANKSGTSLSYLYDALGNKLRKTATVSSVTTVREYVGGIEYNGANIDIIHFPEGYALKSGAAYVYHHNLTDHLGNVRATLKRGATPTTVDVVQRDDYYPFGKRKVVTGGINKYLYNGKEIQGELGDQYDYGARFYDAEIGRWNLTDPMAEKYFDHSPYNYTANNPIRFIDPDGMAWEDSGFGMVTRDLKDITNLLGSLSYQQDQDKDPEKKKKQDPPQKKQAEFKDRTGEKVYQQRDNILGHLWDFFGNERTYTDSETGLTYQVDSYGKLKQRYIGGIAGEYIGGIKPSSIITFGTNANKIYHTFRHIEEAGFTRKDVEGKIVQEIMKNFKNIPDETIQMGSVVLKGEIRF